MNVAQIKLSFSILAVLLLATVTDAQSTGQSSHASPPQSVMTSLTALPEADTILFSSPHRILNEAAPKVMAAADLAKMRSDFADLKKGVGIDPGSIEYVAIAVRFHKPSADLSFVPPDLLVIVGGDFSADSLLTTAGVYLQDRARSETYGSKTLTIMKIDPIEEAAKKNPLLKSFVEIGAVALNSNTLAVGNVGYLKASVDAAAGNGRISSAALNSLLRDPNALVSIAGSPLTAFAKSFGMLGTETTARESRCDTRFGDFYAAITMDATNFNLRGAMNADNPDTAKIIYGLLSSVLQPAIDAIPDKNAQVVLKAIRMLPKESEVVWEADVPQETVAKLIREQMTPRKDEAASSSPAKATTPKPKRRVRRRTK
jgi:hypothetical protein